MTYEEYQRNILKMTDKEFELRAERRKNLEALRAIGCDPFLKISYPVTHSAAELKEKYKYLIHKEK